MPIFSPGAENLAEIAPPRKFQGSVQVKTAGIVLISGGDVVFDLNRA